MGVSHYRTLTMGQVLDRTLSGDNSATLSNGTMSRVQLVNQMKQKFIQDHPHLNTFFRFSFCLIFSDHVHTMRTRFATKIPEFTPYYPATSLINRETACPNQGKNGHVIEVLGDTLEYTFKSNGRNDIKVDKKIASIWNINDIGWVKEELIPEFQQLLSNDWFKGLESPHQPETKQRTSKFTLPFSKVLENDKTITAPSNEYTNKLGDATSSSVNSKRPPPSTVLGIIQEKESGWCFEHPNNLSITTTDAKSSSLQTSCENRTVDRVDLAVRNPILKSKNATTTKSVSLLPSAVEKIKYKGEGNDTSSSPILFSTSSTERKEKIKRLSRQE
jgi:hypothetical protein